MERGSTVFFLLALGAAAALYAWWQLAWQPLAALGVYVGVVSLLTFLLFAWDKKRSGKQGARRVSERVLLGTAALGGAMGAWLAMTWLRHKTRHTRFRIGVPLLAVLHAALLVWIAR